MNCRRARGLFSARIDEELTAAEARSLEIHLRDCQAGCSESWKEFEATVLLVHSLPPMEPDPSFVGQVLDRVRAWEAQEAGRGVGEPVSVSWPVQGYGSRLGERLRNWFGVRGLIGLGDPIETGSRFFGLFGPRVLVSVRFAGAVALGLAGGFFLGHQTLLPSHVASLPGLTERTTVSAPAAPGGTGLVRSTPSAVRPFGDLAGDIPAVRGGPDSVRVQPDDLGNDPGMYPGAVGGRQVLTTPDDARPRVTTSNGRPQLIL
jgi:hypothetical protein